MVTWIRWSQKLWFPLIKELVNELKNEPILLYNFENLGCFSIKLIAWFFNSLKQSISNNSFLAELDYLPFFEESIAHILLNLTLQQTFVYDASFKECHRILKAEGFIILIYPSFWSLRGLFNIFLKLKGNQMSVSYNELKHSLINQGFVVYNKCPWHKINSFNLLIEFKKLLIHVFLLLIGIKFIFAQKKLLTPCLIKPVWQNIKVSIKSENIEPIF